MKLFSQQTELRVIKSITAGSKANTGDGITTRLSITTSSFLLASVDESYFHYQPCKAAYERIMLLARKRSIITSYDELVEDLSLSEEYRDILREYTKKPVKGMSGAKALLETLEKYRRARILYYSAKDILDTLKSDEADIDKLLDATANKITTARTHSLTQDPVLTIGKDANALDLIDIALSTEDDLLLKTGFSEFDRKNGGLPSEGVFILAGTTSGGKSVMRMNLLANMYKHNKIDVASVSFEMNEKKETRRFLSFLSGVPFWKINKKRFNDEDRRACEKAWMKFHRFGEKNDCRYSIMCPTRGLTIQQTLMLMKPYSFKVIAIDYVSLLEGVDEDNQPRMLKSIARECKIFSSENHCLIVLLAQLDSDDSRIRYSKGMLEDADNAWVWNYTKSEDRDRQRIPIKQKKARDQELFDFELEEAFEFMQIRNPPEEEDAAKNHKDDHRRSKDKSSNEGDPLIDTPVDYVVD